MGVLFDSEPGGLQIRRFGAGDREIGRLRRIMTLEGFPLGRTDSLFHRGQEQFAHACRRRANAS